MFLRKHEIVKTRSPQFNNGSPRLPQTGLLTLSAARPTAQQRPPRPTIRAPAAAACPLVTRNNAVSSLVFETPHGNHRLPDGLENLLVLLIACRDQGLLDEDELPASYRAILRSTEPPRT